VRDERDQHSGAIGRQVVDGVAPRTSRLIDAGRCAGVITCSE